MYSFAFFYFNRNKSTLPFALVLGRVFEGDHHLDHQWRSVVGMALGAGYYRRRVASPMQCPPVPRPLWPVDSQCLPTTCPFHRHATGGLSHCIV